MKNLKLKTRKDCLNKNKKLLKPVLTTDGSNFHYVYCGYCGVCTHSFFASNAVVIAWNRGDY